jgi:hypothetical protein
MTGGKELVDGYLYLGIKAKSTPNYIAFVAL